MKTKITIQDIRNLLSRSKGATSFSSKLDLKDVATNLRELIEMFELLYLRFEKVEDEKHEKKIRELEQEVNKLRKELDRATITLSKIVDKVNK